VLKFKTFPPNYIPHLLKRIQMHLVSMAPSVDEDPNATFRLTVARIDIQLRSNLNHNRMAVSTILHATGCIKKLFKHL
jgi:hypothetical protein